MRYHRHGSTQHFLDGLSNDARVSGIDLEETTRVRINDGNTHGRLLKDLEETFMGFPQLFFDAFAFGDVLDDARENQWTAAAETVLATQLEENSDLRATRDALENERSEFHLEAEQLNRVLRETKASESALTEKVMSLYAERAQLLEKVQQMSIVGDQRGPSETVAADPQDLLAQRVQKLEEKVLKKLLAYGDPFESEMVRLRSQLCALELEVLELRPAKQRVDELEQELRVAGWQDARPRYNGHMAQEVEQQVSALTELDGVCAIAVVDQDGLQDDDAARESPPEPWLGAMLIPLREFLKDLRPLLPLASVQRVVLFDENGRALYASLPAHEGNDARTVMVALEGESFAQQLQLLQQVANKINQASEGLRE
jgi:hypothetical protein